MHNFLLTNTVFFTTIAAEFIFNTFQNTSAHVPLEKYAGLFIIFLLFSFTKSTFWRRISMNFVLGLSFFQMMHLQFYSVPVYPNAIYLLFSEMGEVGAVLTQEFSLFLLPTLIVVPLIALNLFIDKKTFQLKTFKWMHFLFIFYMLYNPLRTYFTGNTWGRQPSTQEFMGMNIYLSISYFSGRLLPAKLFGAENSKHQKPDIQLTKTEAKPFNIIFVLGESLTPNHMSLYTYQRATTPYLTQLKTNPSFNYLTGIAAGVSTDVSVAMLMNNTYGVKGSEDVIKGDKCLFKLAKDNGFKTHFYSTQSKQQLRYIINSICPKQIDDYKDLDIIDPNIDDPNKASDLLSIDHLPENLVETNHFFVLHQRSTHSPYELRYPKNETIFKLTGNYQKDRVNHYDNAVFQFDKYMKKLISKVQSYEAPTLIVYVSDHGEGLGEDGVWGHAVLKRPSFEVPQLFYSHNLDISSDLNQLPKNPTHLTLSLLLSEYLGFKANINKFEHPQDYTILANDIDGFAGFLETEFKNGELNSFSRRDI